MGAELALDGRSGPPRRHVDEAVWPVAAGRAVRFALWWAVVFVAVHVYWAFGGRVGFGDQEDPIPDTTSGLAGSTFTTVVAVMFAGGLLVPLALLRPWGHRFPRRALVSLMWFGAGVLALRGAGGLLDGVLRGVGINHGLTGLPYEETVGSAHPSRITVWSGAVIDATFLVGGMLFGRAVHLTAPRRQLRR